MAPRTCSSPTRSWVGCPSSSMAVASLGFAELSAWCLVPVGSDPFRSAPVCSRSGRSGLSRHRPPLYPVDEQAGPPPGRTLGQGVLGVVGARGPRGVDVDPGHVFDEFLVGNGGEV